MRGPWRRLGVTGSHPTGPSRGRRGWPTRVATAVCALAAPLALIAALSPTTPAVAAPQTNGPPPAPPSGRTTSPAGVWMPTAPFNATFFYPWYKNGTTDGIWQHWEGSA